MKKYKVAALIGRFQIPHKGHLALIRKGKTLADKVLILVGSANRSLEPRNPITFNDRMIMLRAMLDEQGITNVSIEPLDDHLYDYAAWSNDVRTRVEAHAQGKPVCLLGHLKDKTSYYLREFPEFALENSSLVGNIHSTDIRKEFFSGKMISTNVPKSVHTLLEDYASNNPDYNYISEWMDFNDKYNKGWANTPYPVNFLAADAVVIHDNNILVVTRKGMPGKGQIALPGGYVNTDETLIEAAMRELIEETGIAVSEKDLRNSIRSVRVFDDPKRCGRGRIVAQATLFMLDCIEQPKVTGSDDASHAEWLPLYKFFRRPKDIFSDHIFIVKNLLRDNCDNR